VSKQILESLGITLFLLLGILLGAERAGCVGATTTLWTELEDLEVMKSRLLIDFPASPYGLRRLMYVEKRDVAERGDSDPLPLPQRWAVGFSSPLITAGPVSLQGILSQLYNPLAHGAGSDVFSDDLALSLNIDLDVSSRRGLQWQVVAGHWSLLGIYRDQIGAQLGSAIAIPFGRSIDCALVGLLSSPPEGLEDGWYSERPLFPGGFISHLAGSLSWELDPLRIYLAAAAAAGQRIAPGSFATLLIRLSPAPVDLDLLLGHCSPQYFTPEGDSGDLEWIAAARVARDFGALHLSAACRKELFPLPPLPEGFRESRDQLEASIQVNSKSASGWAWCIRGDAEMQREWTTAGQGSSRYRVEAGSTLDWREWDFSFAVKEQWGRESERAGDAGIMVGCDPSWGEVELEAGYRYVSVSGFHLAAALEVAGEDKRFYLRLETEDLMPPPASADSLQAEDWLQLFSLRLGWEAKSRRKPRRQPRWRSRGNPGIAVSGRRSEHLQVDPIQHLPVG
jgi:hypothetical protein